MQRRRIIRFLIIFLFLAVPIWLFLNYLKYNVEYYQLFRDQRELFEAVKDEVESIDDSKLDFTSNGETILLYYASNKFHDEVPWSLQDKIRQLKKLSEEELSKLSYVESDEKNLLIFTFDWERVNGDTYHIVYCKNGEVVESYYSDKDVEYDLIKLDDDWYGTRIR
ncbi:hypothetical protein [Bacillus alkalicellulosilyticus]|uniref:hypothetical protein n=1 Tax=Alkalihalobacterium alkalicellulosilyticum TaxID=1912214 RepID=UPI0009978A3B|nr:hypothetical protein [Bacillus alkalicellulosilyticus]